MSVTEFLTSRHSSRAEVATETPIFHALASAEKPIFYALTTAHHTPRRSAPYNAEPFVRSGNPPLHPTTALHRDTQTAPIPIVADTRPPGPAHATTQSSQFTTAPHPLPEQSRRTGRHRLLSCI
jgi:hypothetical protein